MAESFLSWMRAVSGRDDDGHKRNHDFGESVKGDGEARRRGGRVRGGEIGRTARRDKR